MQTSSKFLCKIKNLVNKIRKTSSYDVTFSMLNNVWSLVPWWASTSSSSSDSSANASIQWYLVGFCFFVKMSTASGLFVFSSRMRRSWKRNSKNLRLTRFFESWLQEKYLVTPVRGWGFKLRFTRKIVRWSRINFYSYSQQYLISLPLDVVWLATSEGKVNGEVHTGRCSYWIRRKRITRNCNSWRICVRCKWKFCPSTVQRGSRLLLLNTRDP